MPRKTPENGERLVQYAQAIIKKLEIGEISELPTYKALADQFEYRSQGAVYRLLHRRGMALKGHDSPCRIPEPSSDLAWFLGISSAGGYVVPRKSTLQLANTHENVLEKYRLIGERLFELNAYKMPHNESSWTKSGYRFHSKKIAEFLGDLRSDYWAQTILSNHPWVFDAPRYSWGFIAGFFEKKGYVHIYEENQLIGLSGLSQSGASLLTEILVKIGLHRPSIQGTVVVIRTLQDARLFASHVHSEDPKKEESLENFKTRFLRHGGFTRIYTSERMIEEWKIIIEELGNKPTEVGIAKLREIGKITISSHAYNRRFGQGSFPKAREELKKLIEED